MNDPTPLSSETKLPFYDEQMKVIVEQVMDYLQSERGQKAMRQAAAESKAFADKLREAHNIPWEKFHAPFTI